jgi:hypothetical protein
MAIAPLLRRCHGGGSDAEMRKGCPFPGMASTARWAHLHLKEDRDVDTSMGIGLRFVWGGAEG